MGRGIHRIVLKFKRDRVDGRAQSRSPRGSPFTVGAIQRLYLSDDGRPDKNAIESVVKDLLAGFPDDVSD